MIRTFENAVKWLEGFIPTPEKKHPGEVGLFRMKQFMDMFGNPHLTYPTIHVGGTSGKGSTATIIASILSTQYKVGLHTSPHLVKITERIKLMGTNISDIDFISLVNMVKPKVEKMEKMHFGPPSYFEIVAALAFLYFQKVRVDVAVVEVGMGGKFDATNVILPRVSVLTNVGLDHTDILGETVEEIAADKVGIVKSKIQIVSGFKQSSVVGILKLKCKSESAHLSLLRHDFSYRVKKVNDEGSVFDYIGISKYKDLYIHLLGKHQVENAALAIRTIEQFNNLTTVQLSEEDIREGLKSAYIPGRLKIVSIKPLVILDGAHNPDKMSVLKKSIQDIFPQKRVRALVAIKRGKNALEILRLLRTFSHEIILTSFHLTTDLGDTYSYDPYDLVKIVKSDFAGHIEVGHDSYQALKKLMKTSKNEDLILVTGSLYLIGEIKKYQPFGFAQGELSKIKYKQ